MEHNIPEGNWEKNCKEGNKIMNNVDKSLEKGQPAFFFSDYQLTFHCNSGLKELPSHLKFFHVELNSVSFSKCHYVLSRLAMENFCWGTSAQLLSQHNPLKSLFTRIKVKYIYALNNSQRKSHM